MTQEKKDYIYIRAWGIMMGSYDHYIKNQIALAKQDGAPDNAIYYDDYVKRWRTIDECVDTTKARIQVIITHNSLG